MAREASVTNVVGKRALSPVLRALQIKTFREQRLDVHRRERAKTPEEIQVIAIANEVTNRLLEKRGLASFSVPAENIHVVEGKPQFTDQFVEEEGDAFYKMTAENICIGTLPLMPFAHRVVHELRHMKGYNVLQVVEVDGSNGRHFNLEIYRAGLISRSRNGKGEAFRSLEEAIVEEDTARLLKEVFAHPVFLQERQQTARLLSRYFKKGRTNSQGFYYAHLDGTEVRGYSPAYIDERKALKLLLQKIAAKNPQTFSTTDEIFEVFARASMQGNMLPVARLIDKTFGKGSFKNLAGAKNKQELQEVVASF